MKPFFHRVASIMGESLVASRLKQFINFLERMAKEDAGIVHKSGPLMQRRRCKVSFVKDRTFLFVGCAIIQDFKSDLPLLIFGLFFVVVGCTSLRNVRVATGTQKDEVNDFTGIITYIRDLYLKEDLNVPSLAQKWLQASWKKKAYETNQMLATYSVHGSWPDGFAYLVDIWRRGTAKVLASALYSAPGGPSTCY